MCGIRWALSDAQLSTFRIYELTASRYEFLFGLQGASGAAEPALLETFWTPLPPSVAQEGRHSGGKNSRPYNLRCRSPAADTEFPATLFTPGSVARLLLVEEYEGEVEHPRRRLVDEAAIGTGAVVAVEEELPRSAPGPSSPRNVGAPAFLWQSAGITAPGQRSVRALGYSVS
jgi:hypothetical protein